MDEHKTEEILIRRLEAGQLNNRADLREVERIAQDRGMRKLAKRASKQRRKLRNSRRSFGWSRGR